MALRRAVLQGSGGNTGFTLSFMRLAHVAAIPPPMGAAVSSPLASPPSVLPEFDQDPDNTNNNSISFGFSGLQFGGSMELMAVPKKKVSRHKRGIRNGPKALKPVPVIIRCKSCGRVKLPHFFCCSGERMTEK